MATRRSVCIAGMILMGSSHAAVNDVLPADFFPLAVGSSTFATYAYERKSRDFYRQGQKVAKGDLDTQIVALRLGHFFAVAGQPLSVIAVLPWAQAEVGSPALASTLGQSANGLGDARLGATFWPLTQREAGQYLGISAMLSLPTGDYQREQALNIGENRLKATLVLGWIKPLSPSLVLELTPEVAWYGTNRDYLRNQQLSQRPSYAVTGYLRYRASPSWQFHVGWQENRGGETRVNHVSQNNAPDNARWMLGSSFTTDNRKNQLILRLAGDTSVANGFRNEAELLLRYLRMF